MVGKIFNIQPFSIHDGEGLRTVVFMKGCNLRCFWCHNPESQESITTIQYLKHKCIGCKACYKVCPMGNDEKTALFTKECIRCKACVDACWNEAKVAVGYELTAEELFEQVIKDRQIFLNTGGGITFSGGEPLLQADFIAEVMQLCKGAGVSTAIESAVCVPWQQIEKVIDVCDYVICDLKLMDTNKHRQATGVGNEWILENIRKLAQINKPLLIRTPIIPGLNDTPEELLAIKNFIASLEHPVRYELLPFHNICATKYESLNRTFEAAHLSEPDLTELNKLISSPN